VRPCRRILAHHTTCHGSKGLEYTYVFFMGCYSGLWEGKKKYSQGYKLPPNVFEKETPQESEEELRRLFFVAATRAEKHLFISYPTNTNEGKALEASRFISEMYAGDTSKIVSYPIHHHDSPAGHVFAAMITDTFHHRGGT